MRLFVIERQLVCRTHYTVSQKIAPTLRRYSWKFALFMVSRLKDEKSIKKQTYIKTETCKLCSRVFWIFKPNVIKIDPYNFELYLFIISAFLRHSVYARLSVTRVDQSKTVEVRIMQPSPQSSPIPLVLRYKFNPDILTGSPWAGASNECGVEKTSYFLALCVDILKNFRRYDQSYY